MCHLITLKKMQCCRDQAFLFKWGIKVRQRCLATEGGEGYWRFLDRYCGLKATWLKYHSQGSQKSDTLPVFWCPSSNAPPSRWIWNNKRIMTTVHLNPHNLNCAAYSCTTITQCLEALHRLVFKMFCQVQNWHLQLTTFKEVYICSLHTISKQKCLKDVWTAKMCLKLMQHSKT